MQIDFNDMMKWIFETYILIFFDFSFAIIDFKHGLRIFIVRCIVWIRQGTLFIKYDENAYSNMILTSNDRFWPLRSSAVGASAGAASVFTSSDIFIRFFGIGFELTNFRRRSLNWKDFDLSAKEPILIRLAVKFLLLHCNWPAIFCNI